MSLSFDMLNIFYWVYLKQNITKASEVLYISQPAVSQAIKKMEDTLKLDLFIRTKRGVTPTENAKNIFEYISHAIECINNSEKKIKSITSLSEGTINIGCGTALAQTYILPTITDFIEIYPNININIDHNQTSKLLKNLEFGILDIVIANMPLTHEYNNIKLIKTKKIEDCFFCSKNYKNISNKPISINDLNNFPLILQQKNSHTRNFLDHFAAQYNTVLQSKYELSSASLIKDFVLKDLGIGYLPKDVVLTSIHNKEDIKILELKQKIPKREIGIFVKNNFEYNICSKEFISYI